MASSILAPLAGLVGDKADAATIDFSGAYLNFDRDTMVVLNGDIATPSTEDVLLYPSAGVIQGVSVDVTIEVIATSGTSAFSWDAATSSQFAGVTLNQDQKDLIILNMGSNNSPRDLTLRFKFWETGSVVYSNNAVSGIAVELRNLLINAYDLDVSQWVAFSGFQQYEVDVVSLSSSVISGTTLAKFQGPSTGYDGTDSFTKGRVRVVYNQVSSVDMRIYAPGGALYGIQFGAGVAWPTVTTFDNSFNSAPESTSTSKYVVPGVTASMTIADFGSYSDPDNNPMKDVKFDASPDLTGLSYFNGASTVSVAVGSTISADAIRDGKVYFLLPSGATSAATLSFRVGDGLVYSNTAYSISLLVAAQTQTLTFPEQVAPQSPTSGAFSSSAIASSGLPVTLTSNTPSVCTIHANGTDIVPQITSQRSVCSVTATQAGNSTYASATPVTRQFYFSNQVITFPQPTAQTFVLNNATSSSATANSGLAVTLTSLTPSVCSVSGLDIVTLTTGSCTIRAEQAGGTLNSTTYLAAFPVLRTFQITSGASYSVTYDANSGTGSTPSNVSNATNFTVGTGSLSKTDFTFVGWNSSNTGSGTDYATGSSVALSGNLTLFAKWQATVTFDSQGGSAVNPMTYVFGQAAITLPSPSKSGSAFKGWSLTQGGAVLPNTYSSGTATLYAIWEAVSSGNVPYNGPEITSITPRIVTNLGGELVRVEGRRLGTGNHVTIGGVQVPITNASSTGFSFVMPALSVRVWDMLYTYDGGARLTYLDAITVITYVAPPVVDSNTGSGVVQPTKSPVVPKPWSAVEVASKFAPGSPVINQAVRNEVNLMLRKHARFAKNIECTGFTMGPSVLRVDAKLSLDRATNVCNLIKQLRPKLNVISAQGKQELRLGGEIRRVEVRFTR